jgi:D-alanyl-D-alanine carboxypeptidase/D-alanyl-D-alanine-endopeptidase (penicillin-binding protein 4)
MGRRLRAAWAALALLSVAAPALAGAPLAERLDQSLHHRGLRGARVAVLVVDASDGSTVFARDPDRGLVPASNQKVLTALAALSAFGPAHRFETRVLADAAPDAEGAVSRLYVVAGGDPALTSEDVWRLAADLRRVGLRRVRGGIAVDASLFDDERWHPSWGKTSSRAYNAPVAALSVNYGAFAVRVRGGDQPGRGVDAVIDPPVGFLHLANRAQTLPARSRTTLLVDRRPGLGFEEVVVSGGVPAGTAETLYRSVLDPVLYAASVLRLQLEANGVAVEGELIRAGPPPEAVLLAAFEGRPLSEIVQRFMKHSNNAIGEILVKAMAARRGVVPASWEAGIEAVRSELAALGIDVEDLVLVDGSGLSYANRVSPRAFVEALRLAEGSFQFGPEFVAALPIAAADGTLEERAEGAAHHVRAKTGSLTRVTGLSGYAEDTGGRRLVFSLLVNGFRGPAPEAWDAVDRFVEELVEGEASPATAKGAQRAEGEPPPG